MAISSKDYLILLALQKNPFLSSIELASQLDISLTEVTEKLNDLRTRGIIKKPIAIYSPESIGLERMNVVAFLTNYNSLKVLETICDEHPYTIYRARIFGKKLGIFMQFNIPSGSLNLLNELLSTLKNSQIITTFQVFSSSGLRKQIYPDLNRYDYKTATWNFFWGVWFGTLPPQPDPLPTFGKNIIEPSQINIDRFKILRALTSDASLSVDDLSKTIDLNPSNLKKEYKFVKDNLIGISRFMYDRKAFDLTETVLAFGLNLDDSIISKIFHGINENPPPFFLALDVLTNNNLLLWATMSPGQISDFTFSCWKTMENFQVYVLDPKSDSSMAYWFYPSNYDFYKQKWIDSREYMVTKPLEKLDLLIDRISTP